MAEHPFSVAPMMRRTDRHFRVLCRQLSRRCLLYTEMLTTGALLNGDLDRLLGYDDLERPLALQLGGDDPEALARCAEIAAKRGFDEINLNVGCPSDRVQAGSFGVALMARPELVARAVEAMSSAAGLPITVKHRIGFDDLDRYLDMLHFVDGVAATGACSRFTVHARKAWLKGLSPKENRDVPPLRWSDVHRLKRERPDLEIEINGGFESVDQALEQLELVDAVMFGRAVYERPVLLSEVDRRIYGEAGADSDPFTAAGFMVDYARAWIAGGGRLREVTLHMLHLFDGRPGARRYRRILSTETLDDDGGPEILERAIAAVGNANPGSSE